MTPAEAEAQWRADNPPPLMVNENGETREMTPEEYDERAAEGGKWLYEQSLAQAAQDADQAEGQSIMQKVTALETTAARLKDPTQTFTNQQLRNVMAEHMLVTAQSIRYIHKHSNLPVEEGD